MLKKENLIDHYVVGEGEDTIIELLKGNLNFPGIDGSLPKQVKSLDDIALSASDNDTVETFGVSLVYQYFETDTTT